MPAPHKIEDVWKHIVRGVCFMPHLKRYIAHGSRNGVRSILYAGPTRQKALAARAAWEAENLITYKENEHEV